MSTDLKTAGRGFSRIDTSAGWDGPAAEAFRKVCEGHPQEWLKVADSFSTSSAVIDSYASTLQWAQSKAQQKINDYQRGPDLTAQEKKNYDENIEQSKNSGGAKPVPPFADPGESVRQAAREELADIRWQLKEAGDAAACVFRAQTEGRRRNLACLNRSALVFGMVCRQLVLRWSTEPCSSGPTS